MRYRVLLLLFTFLSGCGVAGSIADRILRPSDQIDGVQRAVSSPEIRRVLDSAREQTRVTKNYSQEYFVISYPNGDPPAETGACTDVIIRSFRAAGIDLQKEVHEDLQKNFSIYPQKWGLSRPDTNIDHRRVLNLRTFFSRKGKSVPVTRDAADYEPGDVVTWDLNGKGMTHVGLVSDTWNENTGRFSIIHNIGGGTRVEDRLFEWEITGHYRYF